MELLLINRPLKEDDDLRYTLALSSHYRYFTLFVLPLKCEAITQNNSPFWLLTVGSVLHFTTQHETAAGKKA